MALEVCELLRLKRRDFKRMFSLTSTFYKRLEKVARERREKIINLSISQNGIFMKNDKSIIENPNGIEINQQEGNAEMSTNKSNTKTKK